jgi:hypothetical protein
MRKQLAIIAATLSLAANAQAHGAQIKPQAKPAIGTVIVYRQASYSGCLISKFPFEIDHGPTLGVRGGRYLRFELPAGDHVISHDHTPPLWAMGQDPQTVHVEAGKTVYFQYVGSFTIIFEVADDQAQAARTVSKMKEGN